MPPCGAKCSGGQQLFPMGDVAKESAKQTFGLRIGGRGFCSTSVKSRCAADGEDGGEWADFGGSGLLYEGVSDSGGGDDVLPV